MNGSYKTHTVKTGDTLWGIARNNRIKHWQDIYFDKANDAFRRRRPNPDKIFPNDSIQIPIRIDPQIRQREIARLRDIVNKLRDTKTKVAGLFDDLLREETKAAGEIGRYATRLDTVGTVVTLVATLGASAVSASKIAALEGEKLVAANARFVEDFAKSKAFQTVDLAAKAANGAIDEPDSLGWMIGKSVAKAWTDMWSPSFWAAGYADIVSQKRFDPTKWNPQALHEETAAKINQQKREAIANLDGRIREYEQALQALR